MNNSGRHITDCVFCRILDGLEEGTFIYRDSTVSAFLDIHPLFEGHTLVVPNEHFRDVSDVKPEILAEVMKVAQMISKLMIDNLGAEGVNIMHSTGRPAGQTIYHFHVHVLPRRTGDDTGFEKWWFSRSHRASRDELQEVAKKLTHR
ncbi:MAG: HIT family protein [Thermoplasmata archaeon]